MDAVAVALMGIGGYMMYAAYKNEHPWTQFTSLLGSSSGATASTTTATEAPPGEAGPAGQIRQPASG